jgi:hypothetical protein
MLFTPSTGIEIIRLQVLTLAQEELLRVHHLAGHEDQALGGPFAEFLGQCYLRLNLPQKAEA